LFNTKSKLFELENNFNILSEKYNLLEINTNKEIADTKMILKSLLRDLIEVEK